MAAAQAGLSAREIAERTKRIDGYGISKSVVGHLLAIGRSRRRTCQRRSADYITAVIGGQVSDYFRP